LFNSFVIFSKLEVSPGCKILKILFIALLGLSFVSSFSKVFIRGLLRRADFGSIILIIVLCCIILRDQQPFSSSRYQKENI